MKSYLLHSHQNEATPICCEGKDNDDLEAQFCEKVKNFTSGDQAICKISYVNTLTYLLSFDRNIFFNCSEDLMFCINIRMTQDIFAAKEKFIGLEEQFCKKVKNFTSYAKIS